jgi:integrase
MIPQLKIYTEPDSDGDPEPVTANPSKPHDSPGHTVQSVVDLFIEEKRLQSQSGSLSPDALKSLTHYLNAFTATFGQQSIEACRQQDLTRWLLAHDTWGAYGKNDGVKFVLAAFRWAAGEGNLIAKCPYVRPRNMPKLEPRSPIRPEEYRMIMALARACNGKGKRKRPSRHAFRKAMFFLGQTGARPCEMRASLWTDLDLEAGLVILSEHKTAHSTGTDRIIPLSPKLLRLLRWMYRHRRPGQEFIFLNSRHRPWQKDFCKTFRKYADLAGIRPEISAYSLRHGFIVQGLERGVGERQLADVVGHQTTRLISWYGRGTRRNADHLRKVLDQVHGREPKD